MIRLLIHKNTYTLPELSQFIKINISKSSSKVVDYTEGINLDEDSDEDELQDEPNDSEILYNDEEYKDDGENKFRIFISSIHLLNIVSMSQHIHADATYKLIWQGFPVLVIGTIDLNKALFHPFGLAICSNEKKTKDFEFIFNSIQIDMQKN
ncbi:unnamed protein product [Rotaria sordida]|uniref:Uncharacterized protein n=1 Tax=Rotaria sordida TaxID=392033 RepID=A0A820CLC5_9BILA|nr:unnamed protein product [Rotaria sordida]